MGRQPSWAISSNVRWAWRLSRRLIWLQSFWNSDIYSSPKFPLFGGTSSFSCMPVFLFLNYPLPPQPPFTAFFSFTSLSFPVPSGSSHYLSVSLFLSFPFLSWEASKIQTFADALHYNLSFLSQSRLLYIVPQKHWSAIHDQNLSRSTWGIWSLSDSSWMQNTAIELILYCIVELQRSFTWINPLHVYCCLCTLEI